MLLRQDQTDFDDNVAEDCVDNASDVLGSFHNASDVFSLCAAF
jgi:hypothetical protein